MQKALMTALSISHIAAGRDHSLALMSDGEVWGWGAEGSGRINLPSLCSVAPSSSPIVVPATMPFARITAGYGTGYGITEDHRAYYWGASRAGLAGKTHVMATLAAEAVSDLPAVAQLAVSEFYGLARTLDGSVLSWGLTRGGPDSVRNQGLTPVGLPAPARHVAVGTGHALAITDDGLLAWGANGAGQLGVGHLADQREPVHVPLPADVPLRTAAAGASHSLAINCRGEVWAWGSNQHGQLGNSFARYSAKPLRVELDEAIVDIAAGMFFSVALGQSGRVYTWGWNGKGQLGRGTQGSDARPAAIPGLDDIAQIAVGQVHVLAATRHALFAWGDNESSQLGPNGQANRGPTRPGWSPAPVNLPI
ncbi:RCC1 domain-containing protein [Eoetvoesiella caeni]